VKHNLLYISVLLLGLLGWQSCRQTLLGPTETLPSPLDFFWSGSELDTGMYYAIINASGQSSTHHLFSNDGTRIFDNTSDSVAFIVSISEDFAAIEHVATSSIFNIHEGFHFSNPFTLLDKNYLQVGGVWHAGMLVHTVDSSFHISVFVQKIDTVRDSADSIIRIYDTIIHHDSVIVKVDSISFAITAQVIDHVDTLHIPLYSHYADTVFGESYIVRYSRDSSNNLNYQSFPSYWLIYYTRGLGPVLIEEYNQDASMMAKVQNRAVLLKR
jgi:hypothetical protein